MGPHKVDISLNVLYYVNGDIFGGKNEIIA